MQILKLILFTFLLVSCSDHINAHENIIDNTQNYHDNNNFDSNTSMDVIQNNVMHDYKISQKKLKLTQIELINKTQKRFHNPLKTLENIWNKYSLDLCNEEFPIDSSRGSIAVTENTLCLITATDLHTTELRKLINYDLNFPNISKSHEYSNAICSFYQPFHRNDCIKRIKKNKEKIINLGNSSEETSTNVQTSVYVVIAEKAHIYNEPNFTSLTHSYFIKGDNIKTISEKGEWVKVSYYNDSKTGWLNVNDLIIPQEHSSIYKSSNKNGYILTKTGIGDIYLGQTYNPEEFLDEGGRLENIENCYYVSSKKYSNEYRNILNFQVLNDQINGISFHSYGEKDIPFQSYTGVKIGDSMKTVINLHNSQPDEIITHIYSNQPVYIYWNDSSKTSGVRYDFTNDKVSYISLNTIPYIRLFEGCG